MQRLSLNALARVACFSPNHFVRLFSEAFGETPHRYLQRRRLEEAARRLREGDDPVVQVALAVGFNNASAFSRAFRLRFGRSPTAERSKSRTARAERRS
jgi:AraC-like DNA-binding protein